MNVLYTIGHSTRTITEFVHLLTTSHIEQLVDIRTIPQSRHNPQFAKQALSEHLNSVGIKYKYLQELGGLRSGTITNTINAGWRNRSFRNYANYMQTESFKDGIEQLVDLSRLATTVIMCAEAVPWRCHRSLVGDALLVRGFTVFDIMSKTNVKEHSLTSFAVVNGIEITYPAEKNND